MTVTPLNIFKMTGTRIDSLVCSDLTEIIVPTGVTEIKESAFALSTHNSKIQRIIIPDSVTKIGAFAMRHCDNLTEVRLPSNLTCLETYTFHDCKKLSHIILPEGLKVIDKHAMTTCGVTEIDIPKSVERIGEAAFMSCDKLRAVTIPSQTTLLEKGVFYKCNNLTIYTVRGSKAEDYAKENRIPCKYIGETATEITPIPHLDDMTNLKSSGDGNTINTTAIEQQPSFVDTLREKTKTKQQLAEEKERRRESQIQSNVQNVVEKVKYDCGNLANRGVRKLSKKYSIYSYEASTILGGELRLCQKTSSLVKQALQAEGFKTVSTSLHRCISGHGYDLHIVVSW